MRQFPFPSAIRAAVFLLLILPALSALAQKRKTPRDGVVQVFHTTGKFLTHEETYKNGLRHGLWRQFDEFGVIRETSYVEGKLNGFWREYEHGNLVRETAYTNNKRDGATFARLKDYQMNGQYLNDNPDGLWTVKHPGHWEFVKRYKDGLRDGVWELKNKNGKEVLRQTYEEGQLVSKPDDLNHLPYLKMVLTLAADGYDPIAEGALKMLEYEADLDYPQTPLVKVIEDLNEQFGVPMFIDNQIPDVPRMTELRVTINYREVPMFIALHELAEENGLTFDYRFHALWLTTPKALAAWKDSTGISELKPANESALAKALPKPPKFDLPATPLSDLAKELKNKHGVELDTTRVKDVKWHVALPNRFMRGQMPGGLGLARSPSLYDRLGIALYQNNCRCCEKDGKLVIAPIENF